MMEKIKVATCWFGYIAGAVLILMGLQLFFTVDSMVGTFFSLVGTLFIMFAYNIANTIFREERRRKGGLKN